MDVRVREARPSDKRQLMSFIKDIWGGHDYIPYVWDEWLRDQSGKMFVVEVDGVPVGMNRVRFLEDGSAWFEGIRIHPRFRGKGLASLLGENSMKVAKARGASTFRLVSGSHNRAAHRQAAKVGFGEKSRVSIYEAPAGRRFRGQQGVRRAGARDLAEVRRLIEGSREFRLGTGVLWYNLAAISLTPEVIERLVREGSVWVAEDAVAVSRTGGEGREVWKQVCFIGGGTTGGVKLVRHALSLPPRRRGAKRFVFVPQRSPMIGALRKDGFRRDFSMILFGRAAPKG